MVVDFQTRDCPAGQAVLCCAALLVTLTTWLWLRASSESGSAEVLYIKFAESDGLPHSKKRRKKKGI